VSINVSPGPPGEHAEAVETTLQPQAGGAEAIPHSREHGGR
jgi:hypothetical protein